MTEVHCQRTFGLPWALMLPTRPDPEAARAIARGRERAFRRQALGTAAIWSPSVGAALANEFLCRRAGFKARLDWLAGVA